MSWFEKWVQAWSSSTDLLYCQATCEGPDRCTLLDCEADHRCNRCFKLRGDRVLNKAKTRRIKECLKCHATRAARNALSNPHNNGKRSDRKREEREAGGG